MAGADIARDGVARQQADAGQLRRRFQNDGARHDRAAGEVPNQNRIVCRPAGNAVETVCRMRSRLLDKQHGGAVRNQLHQGSGIQLNRVLQGRIGRKSSHDKQWQKTGKAWNACTHLTKRLCCTFVT